MNPFPQLNPPDFVARFDAAARRAGLAARNFGQVGGHPLVAYTKRTQGLRPRIYLSAGIHGDEPAPPLALLEMVETGFFDERATWFICPLLNPTGFLRGTRTNEYGIDLNRDYHEPQSPEVQAHIAWLQLQPRFDVTFSLHEDYDANGFYLYELNPENRTSLADAALEGAGRHSAIEFGASIDGHPTAAPGIIRPVDNPALRELWPEAIYLRAHHTSLAYTFETPTPRPLAQRVATTRDAVISACEAFFNL